MHGLMYWVVELHISSSYDRHSAAQMIVSTPWPLLKSLHWLPVEQPVQNSGHHEQGSVDFRSAVHRRTPTTPSDDAVSAVHRCSASLCAVDTHWDRQASVLRGGSERLELTIEWHFVTPVRCQPSVPNWKHTFFYCWWTYQPRASVLTFSWHYQRVTNLFYFTLLLLLLLLLTRKPSWRCQTRAT